MNFNEINNKLEQILNEEAAAAARIGDMCVDNEDQTNTYGVVTNAKFPHFHWVYKEKVHFKFANRRPKTKEELMKTVAFENEKQLLSSGDIKEILRQLKRTINGISIYDKLKNKWKDLHKHRAEDLQKNLIQL